MTNIILWGFGEFNQNVAANLAKENFNIAAHFVEKPQKENQFAYNDLHSGQSSLKLINQAPQEIKAAMSDNFLKDYLIFNTRQSNLLYADLHPIHRDSFSDFNLFFYLTDFFYNLIKRKKVEAVIFSNIPHEGADFVLYYLAKTLNLKTIICYQTIFDKRFFLLGNLSDLGSLMNSIPQLEAPLDLKIKKEFEKKLQYMDMVRDADQHQSSVLKHIKKITSRKIKILLKFLRGKSSWIEKTAIEFSLAKLRLKNIRQYREILQEYQITEPDFSKKFVYFPLHLQPELTTTPLAGKYYDQISAIEKLAEILPPDFYIYVKENPKQNELMRPREFFNRLMLIKNVVLVSIKTNTYDLTRNCQFVATLTGTAGWEAITGGKNVLTFGYAWYNDLPGVFKYEETKNIDELLTYKIDHPQLQKKFEELSKRFSAGYVDKEYLNYTDKPYSEEQNNRDVANAIIKFFNSYSWK